MSFNNFSAHLSRKKGVSGLIDNAPLEKAFSALNFPALHRKTAVAHLRLWIKQENISHNN